MQEDLASAKRYASSTAGPSREIRFKDTTTWISRIARRGREDKQRELRPQALEFEGEELKHADSLLISNKKLVQSVGVSTGSETNK